MAKATTSNGSSSGGVYTNLGFGLGLAFGVSALASPATGSLEANLFSSVVDLAGISTLASSAGTASSSFAVSAKFKSPSALTGSSTTLTGFSSTAGVFSTAMPV